MIIFKNENKINLTFKFKANDKSKTVDFILDGDLNDKKIILKLVDKIRNINIMNKKIDELNKNLEEQKNINEKNLDKTNILDDKINNYKTNIENITEKLNKLNEEQNNKIENNTQNYKKLNDIVKKQKKYNIENENKIDNCNETEKLNNQKKSIIFEIIEYIFENKFIMLFILFILFMFYINYHNNNLEKEIETMNSSYKNNFNNISKEMEKIKEEVETMNSGYNTTFNNISKEIKNIGKKVEIIYLDFYDFVDYTPITRFKDIIKKGIKNNFNKNIKEHKLLYQASRDGFCSEDFHKRCDGKKNTVTLIKDTNDRIFGGFTDAEWDKSNTYKEGNKGFIFSINDKKIYYNKNSDYNIFCDKDYGPIFGDGVLVIKNNCNEHNYNCDWTDFKHAYDTPNGQKSLAGEGNFKVIDYRVYQIELE